MIAPPPQQRAFELPVRDDWGDWAGRYTPAPYRDYIADGYYCMPKALFTPMDVAEQLELQGADKDTIYWAILDEAGRHGWGWCDEFWAEWCAHYAMQLRHDRSQPKCCPASRVRAICLATLGANVTEIVRALYVDDRTHLGRNTRAAMERVARSAVASVKQWRDWDLLDELADSDYQEYGDGMYSSHPEYCVSDQDPAWQGPAHAAVEKCRTPGELIDLCEAHDLHLSVDDEGLLLSRRIAEDSALCIAIRRLKPRIIDLLSALAADADGRYVL